MGRLSSQMTKQDNKPSWQRRWSTDNMADDNPDFNTRGQRQMITPDDNPNTACNITKKTMPDNDVRGQRLWQPRW
jgi:hypothetical protein